MRNWHPLSKLTIAIGLCGLVSVWWFDRGSPGEARVAAALTSSTDPAASARSSPGQAAQPSPSTFAEADADLDPNPDLERGGRTLPPVGAFESMVDRPLFAPARRPIDLQAATHDPAPREPEPAAGPAHPAVDFIGSIEENGRVRALLGDGVNVRGVALGDTIDGWTVLDIDTRRLTLGFRDEVLELSILE